MSRGKSVIKRAVSLSLFLFLVLLLAFAIVHSPVFAVKEVTVTGNSVVLAGEIKALSGIILDTNIFEIDPARIARAVQIHPLIKSAEVVRHLPNRVEIRVEERKPWALVLAAGTFWVIDDCGVCIDRSESISTLTAPVITFEELPKEIRIGQQFDPEAIQNVRSIVKELTEIEMTQISEFHCSRDNQVYIYTVRGTEIRFGDAQRLSEKTNMIDQVLEMEQELGPGQALAYVDLRFKGQPVVKYR